LVSATATLNIIGCARYSNIERQHIQNPILFGSLIRFSFILLIKSQLSVS
jgi:hypothetical protein